MKKLDLQQMEDVQGGGAKACALGLGIAAGFAGVSLGASFLIALGMCSLS